MTHQHSATNRHVVHSPLPRVHFTSLREFFGESLHMVAELGHSKHRDGVHARPVHAGDAAATTIERSRFGSYQDVRWRRGNLANLVVEDQDSRVGYAWRARRRDDGIQDGRRQDHRDGSEQCRVRGRGPSAAHESQQRAVKLVGQVHGVGSGNDRQECDGTGRRGRWSKLAAIYSRRTWRRMFLCAARTHVSESSEGRKSSESGNHEVGSKCKDMMMEFGGRVKISDLWIMLA